MWFSDYIHIMISSWIIRNFISFNISQMFRRLGSWSSMKVSEDLWKNKDGS